MRDEVLSELMGLQPITPQTCTQCHRGSAPGVGDFAYSEAIRRVCTNRIPRASEGTSSR